MRALAAAPIRLIRPFHFVQSPQNAARNGEQTLLKDELDMIVTVLDPVNDRLAGREQHLHHVVMRVRRSPHQRRLAGLLGSRSDLGPGPRVAC